MMNKPILIFLGLILALAMFTINLKHITPAHALELSDTSVHWASVHISKLVDKGDIINGYPDGTFKPENQITRAEFIKMLLMASRHQVLGLEYKIADSDLSSLDKFKDAEAVPWAKPYFAAAAAKGIVTGTLVDGKYYLNPMTAITRAEAATLLGRNLPQLYKKDNFRDAIPDYAKEPLQRALYLGIVKGYSDGTFKPGKAITRAEAAKMLAVYIEADKNNPPPDDPVVTVDNKPQAVLDLESTLGVKTDLYYTNQNRWIYEPVWEEAKANSGNSYFTFEYNDRGYTIVDIKWARILPDINHVQLDLSPIEKVLNMRFPDQAVKNKEIMAKAWQMAEKRRDSNGFQADDPVSYYMGGYEVSLTSMEFNFVSLLIGKPQ